MRMSKEAREQFLAGVHVGVIAVERSDRAPLAMAIWYAYDPGGEVSIFTTEDNLKVKLIRAAGRFSITAQQEQSPYKYVTAEGDVTSIAPADEVEARAVAIRYLGQEAGNRFAEANQHTDTESSVCIRMQPKNWLSSDFSDVVAG
jgi:nitroimidazol reductase NimA-like FMN-containing flavoprotein (pyridoxamine 5'-phosphate oxidase superfamily)